jgi:hypothetical protein
MKDWKWRDGELSYKQFTQLERSEKEKHITFLLTLEPKILGNNDKYILSNFAPAREQKNFISLKD